MPDYDEFGIPIKSKFATNVDEFGIPVKKKGGGYDGLRTPEPITSKSPLQSVGSDYSFDPLKNVVQQEQPLQPKPVAVIPQVQKSNYTYDKSPFNVDELGQPAIKDNTGQVLSINAKTIPITPYGNSKSYIKDLQVRIDTGKLTSQDETFLEKTRKGNNSFNAPDRRS